MAGTMKISMDMSEMMAMMPPSDSMDVKVDSIISFKEIFDEKKDSIAKLPKEEQEKLKLLENYKMHIVMDQVAQKMQYDIYTDFKNVGEANNLLEGMNATEGMNISTTGNQAQPKKKEPQEQPTGVKFSFEDNVFTRDAYIKDEKAFAAMKDSIQSLEAFMGEAMYTIKYTFPKKIKSVSVSEAEISDDGKTVTIKKPFIAYVKDPDELDVEIILEEK